MSRISKELAKANHCGIYEPDLSRIWPCNGTSREAQIAAFAEHHGWRLRFYKDGFCAIFDKQPGNESKLLSVAHERLSHSRNANARV